MASIDKQSNGKYRVRWRDPDGSPRSRTCPTRRSALQLKREVEEEAARGRRWEPDGVREEPDLRVMLRAYLAWCAIAHRPNTVMRYARSLDQFVRWLESREKTGVPLRGRVLSRRLLAEWYEDSAMFERLEGKPRAVATRRKLVEVVQAAWAWIYDDEEFGEAVAPPRKLRMPREPADLAVAPTWDEMDACIRALSGWQQRLCAVLRFTGLRVQQALGLRRDDFDLERGVLRVRGELGKSMSERRGRVVPVSGHLVELLRALPEGEESWLIETTRRPDGQFERIARGRDVTRGWKRAGVREEAWRKRPHHSFRKGFISGLKRAGADADAVEFLVGHSLGLRGVYLDPGALPMREAVDRIPPLDPATWAAIAANLDEGVRFEGIDFREGRGPIREITLDDARDDVFACRHRSATEPRSSREPADRMCHQRVMERRRRSKKLVFLDDYRRVAETHGNRTHRREPFDTAHRF